MATAAGADRFLIVNGVPHAGEVPPVSAFLESTPGAYSTTRTGSNGTLVLLWDRHLRRLADSVRTLTALRPDFFFPGDHRKNTSLATLASPAAIRPLVNESLRVGMGLALKNRDLAGSGEEVAITTVVRGRGEEEKGGDGIDVCLHLGFFVPPAFGAVGASLAVAGRRREVAAAKYCEWARTRKGLEKMRPPMATELLLTNDGDRILEGSVTNFFVVCRKVVNVITDEPSYDPERAYSFEVQTAPVRDGILPGVIRQLVIEICSHKGIPLRETAPSWSDRELWEEAFITSSLRFLQHVETIQAPDSYEGLSHRSWKEASWVVKQFEGAGPITTLIQREMTARLREGGYQVRKIFEA